MRRRHIITLIVCVVAGCSPKVFPAVSDSVRVEYRDRIVNVHDTVTFEVPQIVEKIITRDTVSHLENEWAKSDALVSGGMLSHSLETRPHVVRVPYETFVEVHDTTVVEKQAETVVIEKPKPLTKWQSFQMVLGDIALAVLGVALIALVLRLVLRIK